MKTFLKSAQNQSDSNEICSGSSHEIGRSLPIVFQRNWPQKFPRNSRKIGRFFREFAPENPAKFDFLSRDLPEALLIPNLIIVKKEWNSGPTGRICSFHYTAIATHQNTAVDLDWNTDFCKLQGKRRSAGKIAEFEELRLQFWTEGRKLLSVRVIGSFEISEVRESGIPVSKFLAPVQAVAFFHV